MSMVTGTILLNGGHSFFWMMAEDGEIYGFIETPDGAVKGKTSGWYRTDDPKVAANIAANRFGFTVVQLVTESSEQAACQEV